MKKNIAIAVAALLATACFTGCGAADTTTSDTASVAETTEAVTEEATEEAAEEATEEETEAEDSTEGEDSTEAGTEESTDISIEDLGLASSVDAPEYNPQDAAEADFVGKWEGYCIVEGENAYDNVFGVPVSAMLHFEIKADGTGTFGTGLISDDEENEEKPFKWTYTDNSITFEFEDTDESTPASALISDGYLVIPEEEGDEENYVFLSKVDKFTEFNIEDLYNSMGLGDLASEFSAGEDTETSDDSDSAASQAE